VHILSFKKYKIVM